LHRMRYLKNFNFKMSKYLLLSNIESRLSTKIFPLVKENIVLSKLQRIILHRGEISTVQWDSQIAFSNSNKQKTISVRSTADTFLLIYFEIEFNIKDQSVVILFSDSK